MFTSTADAPVLLEIHHEHERLEILFAELKWALLKPSIAHLSLIRELMDELAALLVDHFAHEEHGGYFDEIVDLNPAVSAHVERLQEQHRQMLASVQHINQQLRRADNTPLWFAMIRTAFSDFVQTCEAHQHEENSMLQEGYLRDDGEGD